MRAKPDEWGVLMAWLWGLSKELDYFETDRDEKAKQLAVDSFSRWAKNRRARRRGRAAQNFPWRLAGNFQKFFGNWEAMTVDSHELVALVAPCPVFRLVDVPHLVDASACQGKGGRPDARTGTQTWRERADAAGRWETKMAASPGPPAHPRRSASLREKALPR